MRPSGSEMDDVGDGSVGGKFGRDRTQVGDYRPQVRTYATINRQSRVDSEQRHVRDKFVKFGDSLVQATGRAGKMFEVVSDDLRGFSKPERKFQEDDVGVRLVCTATMPQSRAIG